MADVMNAVCLHFVWATWDRLPHLTSPWRMIVYDEIATQVAECGCPVIVIGGIEDHVHVVVRFNTTMSIGDLVKRMKGASSRRVNRDSVDSGGYAFFKWQGSYGVFPVEPGSLDRVAQYVRRQEEHHRNRSLDLALEISAVPKDDPPRISPPPQVAVE